MNTSTACADTADERKRELVEFATKADMPIIENGYMFSITDKYRNFIQLNYSSPWSPQIERVIVTVGKLATACMD
ncbi:hypothetical protein [Burkholderia sp. SIMBA_062]|uniref:hypothetical protein n=1 Tax=Burkholderia sp. SIMBA_062 TaxID=3085803 RepID=UPI00397BAE25